MADSADAAATDAEVAAVSTETAARPLEASHDGNKNNLIPVDKLFSARPSTPIAVALPDRNDTGDNTGNVDKADNAADVSAQEQTQSAEQSQMAEQPTSETAEQQSKPMHATQPQTEQPGTGPQEYWQGLEFLLRSLPTTPRLRFNICRCAQIGRASCRERV